MSGVIAWQMITADFLKIRKRRGNVTVALLLACGPTAVFFVVRAAQHASMPLQQLAAGGVSGFDDTMRSGPGLSSFVALAGILIGVDAGACDLASGVFRDLVLTGRSRVAMFATRIPAALALTGLVTTAAYVTVMVAVAVFAGGTAIPSPAQLLDGYGYYLFSACAVALVALGLVALLASRAAALAVLVGLHLIASPIIANDASLGAARNLLLSQAIGRLSPVQSLGQEGMTLTVALLVIAGWVASTLFLGAWRTKTMDA